MVPINYWAVIFSAVAAMGIGYAWYGPLFGKKWIAEMGWTKAQLESKMKENMGPKYILQAVGALLMAFVLGHMVIFASAYLNTSGVSAGLQGAFWSWLGFVVPVSLGSVLWDGKSWTLWFINAGYFLVVLAVMGVILSVTV